MINSIIEQGPVLNTYYSKDCMYVNVCDEVINCVFCYNYSGENALFNKRVDSSRIKEIKNNLKFLALLKIDSADNEEFNKSIYEYVKTLPEFNQNIYDRVMGAVNIELSYTIKIAL